MASVEVLTKARMLEIEAASVVDGEVDVEGDLILTRHDGSTINAGLVRGADGEDGTDGVDGESSKFIAQDTKPTSPPPEHGDVWFCTLDGSTYTYLNDGSSSQWVEVGSGIYNDASLKALVPAPNLCYNSNALLNQRGAVSGNSLAANAYFLDRWKSMTAANAVSWALVGNQENVITVPVGGQIAQVLERTDVPVGSYVLSQLGSAKMRVYNFGSTPPAFANGPIAFTADGTANVVLEFSDGTVRRVKFEAGTTPTTYRFPNKTEERNKCQFYYKRIVIPDAAGYYFTGAWSTTSLADLVIWGAMRTTPTCTFSNLGVDSSSSGGTVASVNTVTSASDVVMVRLNAGATGVVNGTAFFRRITAGAVAWLALDSEIY